MKLLILLVIASAILSLQFKNTERIPDNNAAALARKQVAAYKQLYALSCSPDLASIDLDAPENEIPLLQGWGNYRMPVTATNDSSRIYFEQGINMYYGFHIIESLASFEKALKFDSTFAMAYWGKALAYGPNINDFGYTASPNALTASAKAKAFSDPCTPVEKSLIDAMQVRYSKDSSQSREQLNQLYADAMKSAYAKHPLDNDVAALFADALMNQHPWDFYDHAGKPKPWTPQIVSVLETVLKRDIKHPGAAHYYIHAIEASDHPEKGVEIAKELASLMPGVSHLVHMPSHIFIRSGYYKEGVEVNKQSITSYYSYLKEYAPVANNTPLYLIHNLHMQAACANMQGNYAEAKEAAEACQKSFDSSWMYAPGFFGVFVQYVYMTPYLTNIRFNKWNNVLEMPAMPDSLVYASLLWHYGQGLAYAYNHQFNEANKELQQLQTLLLNKDQLRAEAPAYANEGIAGAGVAEKILQGIIAEQQNNLKASITYLNDAVSREDSMKYNEPRDWLQPARQYLGNTLLKDKQFAVAEKIF